jgi:uncharacterized protein
MVETISAATRRRYILGKQGLWPGRRWQGLAGVDEAVRAMGALQVDPVSVIAPSADIVLWGRVADYRPEYLDQLLYTDRHFFDYGGWLAIYPMADLPYWRVQMARSHTARWQAFQAEHPGLADSVRQLLRERGPLRNRDLDGQQVDHYRAGKNTGVALYYLWLTGELMTHSRYGKERVYDFLTNVAPPEFQHVATEAAAIAHFARQGIVQLGMVTEREFRSILREAHGRPMTLQEAQAELAVMVEAGELTAVTLADQKEIHYFPVADVALIEELENGRCPTAWQSPLTTTSDEVTFLSPLDMVSARGRAAKLFDFNYIWEIYKPAEKRQYGPYTLPILYGDRLVARVDMKLDRPRRTLVVNGFWREAWFQPDAAFNTAFTAGLRRFATFLDADQFDRSGVAGSEWRVASGE